MAYKTPDGREEPEFDANERDIERKTENGWHQLIHGKLLERD